MSIQITILQAKVDSISAELANYESAKANLHVAIQAGAAGRGSSTKLKKIQGKIGGAQLRLSNTEKKLRMALDAQVLLPGPLPDMSSSSEQQQTTVNTPQLQGVDSITNQPATKQDEGSELPMEFSAGVAANLESTAMDIDNDPTNPPPTTEGIPDEQAQGSNLPTNAAASAGIIASVVNVPTTVPVPETDSSQPQPHFSQSFGVSPSVIFPPNLFAPAAPETRETPQPTSPPPAGVELGMEVDVDMNLITAEDKAEMQQGLFQSYFSDPKRTKPIKKRVKYVEVSNSEDTGESAIFHDDEEGGNKDAEQRGEVEPPKPGFPKPPAVRPKPLPTSSNNRESKEKGGAVVSNGGQAKKDPDSGGVAAKGKKREMDPKVASISKEKKAKIQGSNHEDDSGKDKEMAKAARAAETLMKQRKRLADPVNHGKFTEDWLDARSAAERPPLPHGIDLVRFNPDYLPAVATANYDLAIELLLNQTNNYLCLPHTKLNRRLTTQEVDNLQGPIQIWGTPSPRNQNSTPSSRISRPLNHFHCGCHEKVALAGFVMWKTWKAKAVIDGKLIVEGLHQHQPFHPRDVVFILQFLKSKFGYTVEDMFTGSSSEEEEAKKEAQVMKKVANYCARRHYELIGQEMTLDNDFSDILEEEVTVPQWI